MSLKSRLRPNCRYPDIDRGSPVKTHGLLRETDLPESYEAEYARAWQALAKAEGQRKRVPANMPTSKPDPKRPAGRRALVAKLRSEGWTVTQISRELGACVTSISKDFVRLDEARLASAQ